MDKGRVADLLLSELDIQLKKEMPGEEEYLRTTTVQCFTFKVGGRVDKRMEELESATPADRASSNSTSGNDVSDDEDEEMIASEDLELSGTEAQKDDDMFDVTQHAAAFRADWDHASRIVREKTIGYFAAEVATSIQNARPRGNPQICVNGIQNTQLQRMKCVQSSLRKFSMTFDRFFPLVDQQANGDRRRKRTRVLPIHLVPLFLHAQNAKVHAVNPTIPICRSLIAKMERLKFDHHDDPLFLCCLEQLKINTERITAMLEICADAVGAFDKYVEVFEKQLSSCQRLMDKGKGVAGIGERLEALESQLGTASGTEINGESDWRKGVETRLSNVESRLDVFKDMIEVQQRQIRRNTELIKRSSGSKKRKRSQKTEDNATKARRVS